MFLPKLQSRFFGPRWLRIVLGLILVCVLLVIGTDWKGRQMLVLVEQQIAEDGETLDFRSLLPEPPPDGENMGALPVLKNITLPGPEGDAVRERLASLTIPAPAEVKFSKRPSVNRWSQVSKTADLAAQAEWLRSEGSLKMPADSGNAANDIFTSLSAQDSLVQEIVMGMKRPHATWTPALKARELPEWMFDLRVPHYSVIQSMSNFLSLRALSAVQSGRALVAHESLVLQVRFIQATEQEPLLLGTLVAATQTALLGQPLWEYCRSRMGTVEDFRKLYEELKKVNPERAVLQGTRGELASCISSLRWLKDHRDAPVLTGQFSNDHKGKLSLFMIQCVPDGLFDANAASMGRLVHASLVRPLRVEGFTTMVERGESLKQEMADAGDNILFHPDLIACHRLLPTLSKIVSRLAYAEGMVQMMRTACLIEAFHLTHGQYPERLNELTDVQGKPVPVPVDPMTRGPVKYQRTEDGRYRLWMTGPDMEDDGGTRALDPKNPEKTKLYEPGYEGDWVWDYVEVKTEQSKD